VTRAHARGLFEGPAPRLRAIAASAAFLDVLADAMTNALYRADDPFALSDALVLLPNQRAKFALMDAFAKRLGGAALLPTIRAFGELDDQVDVWGADGLDLDIAPAISPTARRLELAALIRKRAEVEGGIDDPSRALALADELCKLLESAATVDEVRWDLLPKLADEVDLAKHWEASARFLDIVATFWPMRLAADGLEDPGARRSKILLALADTWTREAPGRAIVVAGSTGSVAATRRLMRAVAGLPRGVVVFPGLDGALDEEAWEAVGDQHPQFALKETLAALGAKRDDVAPLGAEDERGRARGALMREALAPAEQTADWLKRLAAAGGADFVARGAEGVSLIEAANEDEEAGAIALLMREALETPARTAALVTPDANLARRVEAKLARWGVLPIVSHGMPLRETPAGSLIELICDLARDEGDPVALAALMKHRLVTLASLEARTRLEHEGLRGARRFAGLAELAKLVHSPSAAALVAHIAEVLAPVGAAMARETVSLADFADAVAKAAENAGGAAIWSGRDGAAASTLLREAIEEGGALGEMEARLAPRALTRLMQGRETAPTEGGEARAVIWGPLEARLQRRDLMILGSLNEGVWPAPAPEDPFLSRPMRARLGLASLDARIGLAAHDFAQLANAPEVVLTRATRREGAPAVASRWLWRLETLAKCAGRAIDRNEAALAWARALDAPRAPRAPKIPKPRPPAEARLLRISVTQVETLIRDPYAIYARRILGLDVLKPIGAKAHYAERGTAIHAALERFADGSDAALLLGLLDEELAKAGFPPERRSAELARLAASVDAFLSWLRERREGRVFSEIKGEMQLAGGAVLSAKADRIEIFAGGGAAILDFKTGKAPSDRQVSSGLAPQLPLEAAMLARGAFEGVAAAKADELVYWGFGGADPAPRTLALEEGAHAAGEAALAALETMLKRYAAPEQPFLSKPRVQFIKPYDDYDHLARRKEWADAEGVE
jgi:ATP-dependent helicase/nuclease subunit B